jgi:hypothetical protein
MTAAYIINCPPSHAVDDAIPYELWHNKQLTTNDMKSIKPLGCIVHAAIPKKRRKRLGKVDTRVTMACFTGYTDTIQFIRFGTSKENVSSTPIQLRRISEPLSMSYDISNQLTFIALSITSLQRSPLSISSAIPIQITLAMKKTESLILATSSSYVVAPYPGLHINNQQSHSPAPNPNIWPYLLYNRSTQQLRGGFLVSMPYNGESHVTACTLCMGIYKLFFLPQRLHFSFVNPGNAGRTLLFIAIAIAAALRIMYILSYI